MPEEPNNFFHAVWLDFLPGVRDLDMLLTSRLRELAGSLTLYAREYFHGKYDIMPAFWETDGIRSAGFSLIEKRPSQAEATRATIRFPVFEIGLASDNLIAVEVRHEANETNEPGIVAMLQGFAREEGWLNGKLLGSLRQIALERNPEIFIEGNHNCYINCGECCKKDSRFLAGDGFCIYWTVIGGYCLPILGGRSEGRHPICGNWWCALVSLCPDGDMLAEPSMPRPHIKRLTSYSRQQKQDLLKAIEALASGAPLIEAAGCLRDDVF